MAAARAGVRGGRPARGARAAAGANAEITPVRSAAVSIYGAVALGWHAAAGAAAPEGAASMFHAHAPLPAMPPGASPPGPGRDPYRGGGAAGLAPPAAALGPRAASAPLLGGYREAYRRLASGLAGGGQGRALYPPGHPFYSRAESADALRAENERLRREIADLRAQRGHGGDGSGREEGGSPGSAHPQPLGHDLI